MTARPIRLDRMQAGLIAVLDALCPASTVLWGRSQYPRNAGEPSIVIARLLSGPDDAPLRGGAAGPLVSLPLTATFTVTSAPVGDGVVLRASGLKWDHTITAGQTVGQMRDAVLALIGATPKIDATFTSSGAASIAIAAGELGDLWGLSVRGPATLVTNTSALAVAKLGDVTASIEIQAYAQDRYPAGGAASILAAVLGKLGLPSTADILDAHGLSLHATGRVLNLDALSGPDWESRAAVTIEIGMMSIAAEPAETATSVDLGLEVRNVVPADVTVQIGAP